MPSALSVLPMSPPATGVAATPTERAELIIEAQRSFLQLVDLTPQPGVVLERAIP